MNARKSYHTRQRTLILSCLRENGDRPMTAEMVVAALRGRGEPVGQTTVYRNLDKLVREGVVLRLMAPEGASACYRYLGQPDARTNRCHLLCTGCGQMVHLTCNQIGRLTAHMQQEHGFSLDSFSTILYGRCESCAVR